MLFSWVFNVNPLGLLIIEVYNVDPKVYNINPKF